MKVLHVIPSLSPLRGGPTFALLDMARGLSEQGVEVHVAATDDDGRGRATVPGATPIDADHMKLWYFSRQTRFYTISIPLSRWFLNHARDYGIIHIHALFSYPSVQAALIAMRNKQPYVIRPLGTLGHWELHHGRTTLKRVSLRLLESHILQRAAAVHFTSHREMVETQEMISGIRPALIPLGIDPSPFDSKRKSGWLRSRCPRLGSGPIVLYMSRLDEKKGIELLLEALSRLVHDSSGVGLVIAGEGDPRYVKELKRTTVRLGVDSATHWVGFLGPAEKAAAIADADIFVLPSYSENFGRAAIEAMAGGLPVVVSDQVGVHSEVDQAGAGLIVKCDAGEITAAIRSLAEDEQFRHDLGGRGRRLVRRAYSLHAMSEQLAQLYRDIEFTD